MAKRVAARRSASMKAWRTRKRMQQARENPEISEANDDWFAKAKLETPEDRRNKRLLPNPFLDLGLARSVR